MWRRWGKGETRKGFYSISINTAHLQPCLEASDDFTHLFSLKIVEITKYRPLLLRCKLAEVCVDLLQ